MKHLTQHLLYNKHPINFSCYNNENKSWCSRATLILAPPVVILSSFSNLSIVLQKISSCLISIYCCDLKLVLLHKLQCSISVSEIFSDFPLLFLHFLHCWLRTAELERGRWEHCTWPTALSSHCHSRQLDKGVKPGGRNLAHWNYLQFNTAKLQNQTKNKT